MLPLLGPIREAVSCPVSAVPVAYRTTEAEPTFQSLSDPGCGCLPEGRPFPTALDPFVCNRYEIEEFTRAAQALGVNYLGVCCGAGPHHIRSHGGSARPPSGGEQVFARHVHACLLRHVGRRSRPIYKEFAKHL